MQKKGHPSAPELLGRTYTFWGIFFLLLIANLTPKIVTYILFGVSSITAIYEYFQFNQKERPHLSPVFWISILCLPLELYFFYQNDLLLALALPMSLILLVLPTFYILKNNPENTLQSFGHQASSIIFFIFALSSGAALINYGPIILLICIVYTEIRDLVSYWMGKFFAKLSKNNPNESLFKLLNFKIADKVSPNKTWSVGILSTFFLIGLSLYVHESLLAINFNLLLTWSLLLGFFGLMGDLAFSLFKREFGLKDSGSFLPGGTGIIDRIDSLIFTFPVSYFLFYFYHS